MEESSQAAPTVRYRPWTEADQQQAEAMRAEGAGYTAIGRVLGRHREVVRSKIDPTVAERRRENTQRWRNANPDKFRESMRRSYEANSDKRREYSRLYGKLNREKIREKIRLNPEKNREKSRRYYWANWKKSREANRRWREANLDRKRAKYRLRYQANPEKMREKTRRWAKANPEKRREAARAWAAANPEKRRELNRRFRETNREKVRSRQRRCYALRRASRRRSLAPVTCTAINARFELWRGQCAYCGVDAAHSRNAGHKRLTEDHALALVNGGLDEASNILPACLKCNSGKRSTLIEEWYRRQPFFTESRWRKIRQHCPDAVIGQPSLALL
jgi:hypothetical protein